jgi:hypothetical protein
MLVGPEQYPGVGLRSPVQRDLSMHTPARPPTLQEGGGVQHWISRGPGQ